MSIIDGEMDLEMYEEQSAGVRRQLNEKVLRTPLRHLEQNLPVWVSPSNTVLEAVNVMNQKKIGCVLVVDTRGELVGIFTERDVMQRVVETKACTTQTKVGDVMTPNPDCLAAGANIGFALHKMVVEGYRHIPIVDE